MLTEEQIAAARAEELTHARDRIDTYLLPLAGVAMIDKHHRALLEHVRSARETMTRACDLQGAKECAKNLHKAYTLPKGHKFAVRALEALAEQANEPFRPIVDLEGGLSFL
jgi:ABC-type transporter Mla MlaB component